MDRLQHLRQTLACNILANADYPALEFVLLDYHSREDVAGYVREALQEYIRSGLLTYYQTFDPLYFNRSHSRNMMFRLATGDIICNVDADNFTGKGFAAYVSRVFSSKDGIFLTGMGVTGIKAPRDVMGRICLTAGDLEKVRGFDERMTGYGFEDYDIANRLESSGLSRVGICMDRGFLCAIPHDERGRILNEELFARRHSVYLSYLTAATTEILYLFSDGIFARGTLIDNRVFPFEMPLAPLRELQMRYEYSIYEDGWLKGRWKETNGEIDLYHGSKIERLNRRRFYEVEDEGLIIQSLMFYSQLENRIIMDKNKLDGQVGTNPEAYGAGVVYKNFEYDHPILLS